MLNLLSGYYEPTAGAIRYLGEELGKATVQRRAAPRHRPHLPEAAPAGRAVGARQRGARRLAAQPRRLRRHALRPALDRRERPGPARARRPSCCTASASAMPSIAAPTCSSMRSSASWRSPAALRCRPRFILLDEPAGGLTAAEIDHLGGLLRTHPRCRHRRAAGRAPHRLRLPRLRPRHDAGRRADDQARDARPRCAPIPK